MKARIRISLSSASVCTSAIRRSRSSSITSPASRALARNNARRPEIMFVSPVNSPGLWTAMSVSTEPDGRTISTSPEVTTKNGTT